MRSGAVYEACPYCLAEITVEKPVLISASEPKIPKEEENKAVGKPLTEKGRETQAIPDKTGCRHYFGYLSNRSSKDGIPEECIVCEKIVQCMLKTMTE
ncbi:MAG: hypothetical protein QXJ07_00930 [Candidatus Bathyarchaeia archaeon]